MSAVKTIAYIASGILIFFGILFVWGAFSPEGTPSWIIIGLISMIGGFALIWFIGKRAKREAEKLQIIQKIELSGDINLETLTCRQCGGVLSSDNIKMMAGAPVVTCPYCNASYQLTEEPKW